VPLIQNKSLTLSPAKHPYTITSPPHPCFMVGTTHAEIIRSPTLHLTKTRQLEAKIATLDSTGLKSIAHVYLPKQVTSLNQIKSYLSHAPNTTALNNNAVQF
jgi:hypothetical protein